MNEQTDEPGNRPHPGEKARPEPPKRQSPFSNNNRPPTVPSWRFLFVFWLGLMITLLFGWWIS